MQQPRELSEILSIVKKFGSGIACIDSILGTLKGYLVPINSEVDKNKVFINVCIPFTSGSKEVKTNIIQISKVIVQETPLTTKCKPEYLANKRNVIDEYSFLKEQVNIVNNKQRQLKRSIESCDTIDIKPSIRKRSNGIKFAHKYGSESDSSDVDLIEQNDVSNKMMSYNLYSSDSLKNRFDLDMDDSESQLIKDESSYKQP